MIVVSSILSTVNFEDFVRLGADLLTLPAAFLAFGETLILGILGILGSLETLGLSVVLLFAITGLLVVLLDILVVVSMS